MTMYHAMFPPQLLVHLMGQPHLPDSASQRYSYGHNQMQQRWPIELLQLMGVDLPPVRNRGFHGHRGGGGSRGRGSYCGNNSLMPPPMHLNGYPPVNCPMKRNYWGNKNASRAPRCITRDPSNAEASYSSDSGFSSRSPTPNKHPIAEQNSGDDLEDPSLDSARSDSKGVKRQHEMYNNNNNNNHAQHNGVQYYRGQGMYQRSKSPSGSSLSSQGSCGGGHQSHQNKRRYHSGRHSPPHRAPRGRRLNGTPTRYSPNTTPPDRFLARANQMQVTSRPPEVVTGGEWDKLSEAIWNRFMENQQTEETFRKKMMLWKDLYVHIRDCFPRYGLFLVGSTMSGFGSDKSDVDMCLLVRHTEMDQRNEAVKHLEVILNHLKKCDFVTKPELIQAKVPILKFHDSERYLEVDLNCNNAVGIRNTHLLYCYSQMDWRVRPLVLIIKLWAHAHNINDAKNMTISSYSLVLMVIHYLQCGVSPPVLPCLHILYKGKFLPQSDIHGIDMHEELPPVTSENTQTLGELLLGFLHYYSQQFDFNLYAISVRLASRLPIEECRRARSFKNDPHQWKYLCIEEPFDLTNTARSVYDRDVFERVKAVFHSSWHKLKQARDLESIFLDEKD